MADAVQPGGAPQEGAPQEPGQGAPEEGGLYGSILEGVPSEYHESLTERLKENDAKATQKFQSLSERSKPYEDAGVFDSDPEALQGWMNLSQALDAAQGGDEQAQQEVSQWWEQLGDALGFFEDEGGEGTDGEAAQDLLDLNPQQLQAMIGEQITQATSPLMERMEQQEQDKLLQEAQQGIQEELSALRQEHQNLTDDDEKYILALAWQFGQDAEDPVATGFQEFQRLVSRGENNLFESKVNQPAPAEGGGMPNTAVPAPENDDQRKQLAQERLAQMQAT